MFMMPILWIAVIGLIVWAVATVTGKKEQPFQSGNSALDELKRSYARGEIDKAQFEAKKKDLV